MNIITIIAWLAAGLGGLMCCVLLALDGLEKETPKCWPLKVHMWPRLLPVFLSCSAWVLFVDN